ITRTDILGDVKTCTRSSGDSGGACPFAGTYPNSLRAEPMRLNAASTVSISDLATVWSLFYGESVKSLGPSAAVRGQDEHLRAVFLIPHCLGAFQSLRSLLFPPSPSVLASPRRLDGTGLEQGIESFRRGGPFFAAKREAAANRRVEAGRHGIGRSV